MIDSNSLSARVALVEQHIQFENVHDIDGVLTTLGRVIDYDDEAWGEHYEGQSGARQFYEQIMKGLPDLEIDVQRRHVCEEAIIIEVSVRGTHLDLWRGLPATGRRIEFPLCALFTFDAEDRLAAERIYYDRMTVLSQLGVSHESENPVGNRISPRR